MYIYIYIYIYTWWGSFGGLGRGAGSYRNTVLRVVCALGVPYIQYRLHIVQLPETC